MENMNLRTAPSAWMAPSERALVLPCATRTADLRTDDVRSNVRVDVPATAAIAEIKRERIAVPTVRTTGMGHVGFAGYVPGSLAWSPPI